MSTVAGLFDNQKDAQGALDALAGESFAEDLEFTVIEEPDETVVKGTFPGGTGGVALSPPLTIVRGKVAALDIDDELMSFLRRGVQRGGVVVAVEGDDEYVDQIEAALREHNAQLEVE